MGYPHIRGTVVAAEWQPSFIHLWPGIGCPDFLRPFEDTPPPSAIVKRLATNQLVLTVGYDIENLKGTVYTGEVTTDRYGRKIPKHAHGTVNLDGYTSSGEELLKAATSLYDRIVDKTLLARRLTLCANHLLDESSVPEDLPEQIDLFTDYSAKEKQKKEADTAHARERKLQETMLDIKKRFGKNAILKGLNLEDGATARERNNQIGGHKA